MEYIREHETDSQPCHEKHEENPRLVSRQTSNYIRKHLDEAGAAGAIESNFRRLRKLIVEMFQDKNCFAPIGPSLK